MIHQTWDWRTADNSKMFAQKWMPDKGIKASIILIHGFGEHSNRYAHMAEFYCQHHIQVLTFDLRGHGRSADTRGYIPTQSTFWDDLNDFLKNVKDSIADMPVFLYGHSMGGMIVLSYVLKYKPSFTGVIVTAPLIDTATPLSESTKKLAKVMNKIAPKFAMDSGLDRSGLSRDKAVVDAYNADPFIFGKATTRLGVFLADTKTYIQDHASEFKLPLLTMVGTDDRIVSKNEIDIFMKSNPKATYKVWDGFYHELHNEPGKEEVFEFTLDWIKKLMK
jgi:alpha-beta hydrolase superfamily lysophospholipase